MNRDNNGLEELRKRTENLAAAEKDFQALKTAVEAGAAPPEPPRQSRRRWIAAAAALLVAVGTGMVYRALTAPSVTADLETGTVSEAAQDDGAAAEAYYDAVYQALRNAFDTNASEVYVTETDEAADDSGMSASSSALAAGAYGETNVQVQGVDEVDIVKNDGENLYILSYAQTEERGFHQMVSVVRAADMTLLSQWADFEEEYNVTDMYLWDRRLVVIGTLWETEEYPFREADGTTSYGFRSTEKTVAQIFDVGADGGLTLQRAFAQDGTYNTSRMVDGRLYLVSNKYVYEYADMPLTEESLADYIPATQDSAGDSAAQPLPAACIYIAPDPENSFTVVSALVLDDADRTQTHTLLGKNGNTVYATEAHLYIASFDYYGGRAETCLYKFELGDGTVAPAAEGTVPGYLNNQFSMDEYDGNLRLVTTQEHNGTTRNLLYVLDEALTTIGTSQALAPDEYVQSVRFMGDMGYVVTFRETDPLFAIDLSDPENPEVLGYLKIPGFSTYMHPIDETTLLGVGYDADEETGGTTGLKFSLFDVSDPANPVEHSKLVLTGDCYSGALHDHKAVTYLDDTGLLAIPIIIYSDMEIDGAVVEGSYQGRAIVLELSKETGFAVRGLIADPLDDENLGYRGIDRITYIGDRFYTVSSQSVMALDMDSLEILAQLDLFEWDGYENWDDDAAIIEPYPEEFAVELEIEQPEADLE